MSATATQRAPDPLQARTAADDGGPRQASARRPAFGLAEVAFLIAIPLLWAGLLMFHGDPAPGDIYGSLRDEVTRWLIVYVGSLLFVGLMGAALYLLVRDLRVELRASAGGRSSRSCCSTVREKRSWE